ncbi:sodium channel modifier 1-like [Gastrophryne carolinensis]
MSFKREGDDGSQLNVLRKRRVADLLSSFIPEDEAVLLNNGRYACAVCHHRPVFDTIDMLSIHRNGKKHAASLHGFYLKKTEFRNAVQKRRHQDYVRAEEAGEQLPRGPAPLLAHTRRIAHHALLKSAPYSSCCSRNRPEGPGKMVGPSEPGPPPPSLETPRLCYTDSVQAAPTDATTAPTQTESCDGSIGVHTETKQTIKHKKRPRRCLQKEEASSEDPEKKQKMEHYLHLRSSGWIPDGTGKWVKDENVEFDSDEEEPPALPPP